MAGDERKGPPDEILESLEFEIEREPVLIDLLREKFPRLTNQKLHLVLEGEDSDGLPIETKFPDLLEPISYLEELNKLPSADLFAFHKEVEARQPEQGKKRPSLFDAISEGWFYDQPDAQADFEHWSRAEYWTSDEAVAISFGKNPKVVNGDTLKNHLEKASFANEYYLRRDLVDRAIQSGRLPREMPPADFVAWLQERSIPVPRELADCLSAIEATSSRSSTKPLSDTERDSLLKLLLAMSIDKYDYKVGKTRNPATGENRDSINAALERLDLKLTSDTIRKYLKEAEQRFGDHLKNPRKD